MSIVHLSTKRFLQKNLPPSLESLLLGADTKHRYSKLACYISCRGLVLELGSGTSGLVLLSREKRRVISVDRTRYGRRGTTNRVLADARFLPFANSIFETVVSVDMIEHIPASGRQLALNEMKRVTRRLVVLHTPVESPPLFLARQYDTMLLKLRKKVRAYSTQELTEHVSSGHPTLDELTSVFPGASIIRTQNCHTWYFVMAIQSIPPFVPIMGLAHRILKRVYDRGDCFYSCVLVYDTTQANTNPLGESEMETCAVVGP
ncbi:class I SAM-dependent methyltransferase [Candidatus Bathyarchaeota archaeon]|nr:MAG: class I SAM-dependent methyltransferase [Candidatus Bathyarchaeota archaeon]TMI58365.1 MAG: class I SAM-dependent methyltransferase [Candidatus Bathyarchaeota archaeon]